MAMTLAELKAENEAEEAKLKAQTEENTTTAAAETKVEEAEPPPPKAGEENEGDGVDPDKSVEPSDSEPGAEPEGDGSEDWMKGEGQSPAEKKFTDSDVRTARLKAQAKTERKYSDEIDQLRAENEKLKNRPATPIDTTKPRRDDFLDAEDPDEAYFDALTDWKIEKERTTQKTSQQAAQIETRRQDEVLKINQGVDQHYERVVNLAEKSGITAEAFRAAETQFRQTVRNAIPGSNDEVGDAVADAFIAKLGEGSEKVVYNLGINAERRSELMRKFQNDPTGLDAGMYLAELKAELTAPSRRKSTAPDPAADLKGDVQTGSRNRALKTAYDKAAKKDDGQAMYDAKKAARAAGADTSTW